MFGIARHQWLDRRKRALRIARFERGARQPRGDDRVIFVGGLRLLVLEQRGANALAAPAHVA
jgi:hypothetical protein